MEVYMRIYDIIEKKRDNKELTKEEIDFFINGYVDGSIPDYQASALLMAIFLNGMNDKELTYLTNAMAYSGDMVDLSKINGFTVDKHSTGGVGDKTSLVICPIVASLGCKIAKLSGRGLGHTGGTIDKLEAIPGFKTNLEIDELIQKVQKVGLAIGSQTKRLTPADGMLYALRDVTATVDSIPLIASSVVSKKIASGADYVVLDVKYGSGAFIKTPEKACELAQWMVDIAAKLGKKFHAVITSMEQPLGRAVGNAIEVIESVEFLKGNMTSDIKELTYEMAALTLCQLDICSTKEDAYKKIDSAIDSGKGLQAFSDLIRSQCGNPLVLNNYRLFPQPEFAKQILAKQEGYIKNIDAYKTAYACKLLGAGRDKKTDPIDYSAGIYLEKIFGEKVLQGDVIATLYTNDEEKLEKSAELLEQAFVYSDTPPNRSSMIYKII